MPRSAPLSHSPMTISKTIRTVLLVGAAALGLDSLAFAQYPSYEPSPWHATGFVGFSLTHTSQSMVNQPTETAQLFPVGDVRLNGDGYLLDPKFLHLNLGFDFQKGANTSDRGDLGMGGINAAVGGIFLPKSHVPFRASYTKSNHGVTGLGLNQNEDDSRLDLQWNMLFPNLPQLTASFQQYSSKVHVPTSFADRTYDDRAFSLGATDLWKGWHWAGNFSVGNGSSAGISPLSLDSLYDHSARTAGFNASRTFWDNKAQLLIENREVWRRDNLIGDGNSTNAEYTDNVTFSMQVSPKISIDAGYGFAKVDFEGTGIPGVSFPGTGPLQLISLVSSSSHTGSGRLGYRPLKWLRLLQEVRTIRLSPATGVIESRTSFSETASTVSAEQRWRGLDLMASYTGRFQLTGTTLSHLPNSWSNSYRGRVGWGNVRYVRLSGFAQNTRLNLVEQIGGFTNEKSVGLEAETHSLKYFRLRANADYSQVELLNISGDTRNKITSISVQADQRLVTIAFTKSFMDGAGALFPIGLIDTQFLVISLPLSQLIATPLLDRTTHAQTFSLTGRPLRRLEVSLAWRTEDTKLSASDQTFDILQTGARYRLGKFSFEGGYSRFLNDVTVIAGLSGNRLSIWYFRIGRDFRIR